MLKIPITKTARLLISLGLLAACLSVYARSQIDMNEDVNAYIGMGFDSVTREVLSDCVEATTIAAPGKNKTLKAATYTATLVENQSKLEKAINAEVFASYRGVASGKMNFLRQKRVNSYSLYVLVRAVIRTFSTRLVKVRLIDDAVQLAKNNPKRFRAICGNEYISTTENGGEIFGIIEIFTESAEEHRLIKMNVKGKINAFQGGAILSNEMKTYFSSLNKEVRIFMVGGDGTKAMPTTLDGLIKTSSSFVKEVVNKPATLYAHTKPYKSILNYPDIQPFELEEQSQVLERLRKNRSDFINKLNDLDFILVHPEQFIFFDEKQFKKLENVHLNLSKNLNKINGYMTKCLKNIDRCEYPTDLVTDLRVSLPKRIDSVCQRSSMCGVERYRTGTGQVCGIAAYNVRASAACGVALWNKKRDPKCGPELHKMGRSSACGLESLGDTGWIRHGCSACGGHCEGRGGWVTSCTEEHKGWRQRTHCRGECMRHKQCRHSSHGVERDKECRREEFGVEKYRECEHQSHGVRAYKPCRHSSFGVELYKACKIAAGKVLPGSCTLPKK